MSSESRFIYVHDPMCSWCWGHRPVWDKLVAELSPIVMVDYRVGGLAPDSNVPMSDAQKEAISGIWSRIQALLGTEFNFDFWTDNTPRRSTYPACRASIAARWQDAEESMIKALQEAYYLKAMNPSDVAVHLQLAEQLGLDVEKFAADVTSEKLEKAFGDELNYSHSLPIQGFPSMVLIHQDKAHSIMLDYKDHRGALEQVKEILAA